MRRLFEKAEDMPIADNIIDESTIRIWTVFADKKINALVHRGIQQSLDESVEPVTGDKWRKMSFWEQLKDTIVQGTYPDGSVKKRFSVREFPTKIVKDENMTAKVIIDLMDKGFNIQRDSSTASPEQKKAATQLLLKAFDREALLSYEKYMQDISNVAAAGAGLVGAKHGGVKTGAAAAAATKIGLTKYAESFRQEFNDQVAGTEFAKLKITDADVGKSWFMQVVGFAVGHPYISAAVVISLVLLYKNRSWIWDRIKLGFNNLWQGKVIAVYKCSLVDGTALKCEYDLRFNKWRLLYDGFQWRGAATPSKMMVASFIKTKHFQRFLAKTKDDMQIWFDNEDVIRSIVSMNEDDEYEDAADLITAVLDDKKDIESSLVQGEYKEG